MAFVSLGGFLPLFHPLNGRLARKGVVRKRQLPYISSNKMRAGTSQDALLALQWRRAYCIVFCIDFLKRPAQAIRFVLEACACRSSAKSIL